jgi:predicted neutral ceramidase superfamily lipid hydrolase
VSTYYEVRVPDLATLTQRIIDDHPAGGGRASRRLEPIHSSSSLEQVLDAVARTVESADRDGELA